MHLKAVANGSMVWAAWLLVAVHATSLAQTAPASTPVAATTPTPNATSSVGPVYRCPGPPVLYTDAISANEARERGCRTIEGAPITVVQLPRPRPAPAASAGLASGASAPRGAADKVDPSAQRQRDSDARRILESELRREEDRATSMRREYNNGEPERRGDERNFQNYLDRVAQMRAALQRSESDIVALRRELSKLPATP